MILYRLSHPDYPFLWESDAQPPGRWHGAGEGPVHYFSTTPEGAWAEMIRHEEITELEDLKGLRGPAMWVVDLEVSGLGHPELDDDVLTGNEGTYPACRAEARRLRSSGNSGLLVRSAALRRGGAGYYSVRDGLRFEPIDSRVVALFGARPDVTGQLAAVSGRPQARLLAYVRYVT